MCHVTKHVLRMRRGLVAERARSKMAADILDDDQWLYGEEGKPLARIGESLVHLPVFCFFSPASKVVKEEPQPVITENGRFVLV